MTTFDLENQILAPLNPAQREAVVHGNGPLLVLAGAGSGKTRVIVHRIAHLIGVRGIRPWRILAVTFTNKAAGEMRHRLEQLIGRPSRDIWAHTFHAFCARFLRYEHQAAGLSNNFVIFDTDDQRRLLQQILKLPEFESAGLKPASVQSSLSYAKTRGVTPDSDEFARNPDPDYRLLGAVYSYYQAGLRGSNAVDFDDLLLLTVRALEDYPEVLKRWQGRFDHVLIDEYQDTNQLQYLIAHYLVERHGNVCAVGDDDQSIYRFRGADVGNILEFERDFPNSTLVKLEENYRSTGNILDASWHVVNRLPHRHPKKLFTQSSAGESIRLFVAGDEEAEASWISKQVQITREEFGPQATIAVLYRANWQSRVMEEELVDSGILYKIIGTTRFYERREVRDLIAYLRLIANEYDAPAFRRIINVPRRGLGDTTIDRIEDFARQQAISLPAAAERATEIEGMSRRMAEKAAGFAQLIKYLRGRAVEGLKPLIETTISETGYGLMLKAEPDGEDRLANLAELISHAVNFTEEFESAHREPGEDRALLEAFLERVALLSDVDEKPVPDAGDETVTIPPVTLMTVHAAKGLEFDAVFISGLEEEVFPHRMVLNSDRPEDIDEERRLLYVGMTRARKRLCLSHAQSRRVAGQIESSPRSRFLNDIPKELLQIQRADMGGIILQRGFDSGRTSRTLVGRRTEQVWPKVGEPVRHPKFGVGQVISAKGAGSGRVVVVDFREAGQRTLNVEAARLTDV